MQVNVLTVFDISDYENLHGIERRPPKKEDTPQKAVNGTSATHNVTSSDATPQVIHNKKTGITRNKYSPILVRKSQTSAVKKTELSSALPNEKLSSPSLVGQNRIRNEPSTEKQLDEISDNRSQSPVKIFFAENGSPKVRHRSPSKDIVLRQPKKSEMAYFGVQVSPKASKKEARKVSRLSEKPDLLQHHETKPIRCSREKSTTKTENRRVETKIAKKPESPIYVNLQEVQDTPRNVTPSKREFDSSILEELTKAADQILQAVNGYADDDVYTRLSGEESKRHQPLDTISETKSWKQQKVVQTKTSTARTANSKSKLKHTSSTSSVDSITRECRKPLTRKQESDSAGRRKKVANGSTPPSIKATTKQRRLQRASSREALLQSHGSSSEDLPANVAVPLRKPRLVKKTKTTQLTITNGIEMSKKTTSGNRRRDDSKGKLEDR